jgi:hypothetical protein
VAIFGTSGTFVGTSRRLKELNPAIRYILLQPDSPFHGIEGTKHMETSIVPRIYDGSIADAELGIETEAACTMTKTVAREEACSSASPRPRRWSAQCRLRERPMRDRLWSPSFRLGRQVSERTLLG